MAPPIIIIISRLEPLVVFSPKFFVASVKIQGHSVEQNNPTLTNANIPTVPLENIPIIKASIPSSENKNSCFAGSSLLRISAIVITGTIKK